MAKEPNNPHVVFPELRLVTYDANNKAMPVVSIGGDRMTRADILDAKKMKDSVGELGLMLHRLVEARNENGSLAFSEPHNNHTGLTLCRQLLNLCESGKAGFKCGVTIDPKVEGRKFLIVQVDKPT